MHPAAIIAALILLPTLGCMSDQAFENWDDTGSENDSGGDPTDSDEDTGDADQPDPSWWALSATILVEDTLPVQGDTTLVISLIDEDADIDSPICQASYDGVELGSQDLPDPLLFHWWQATLAEPTTDCSTHLLTWIPSSIQLGIGALHPDVAALLEPAGLHEIEPYLYGAYLQASSQTIWTYGVSATAAGFAGEQLPVAEAPVPDGTYSMVPIYLLPLQGG
jgi:hypothetical protein